MSLEPNPYASPLTTDVEAPTSATPSTDKELIRRKYLNHEFSVRSLGLLYYFMGGVMVLAPIMALVLKTVARMGLAEAISGVCYLALGLLVLAIGWGLRGLRPWTRVPVGILSGIGLMLFPSGALISAYVLYLVINAYILYLVFSPRGATVFSPEYREIIRQTPHVTYQLSRLTVILLGIFLTLMVFALLHLIFAN